MSNGACCICWIRILPGGHSFIYIKSQSNTSLPSHFVSLNGLTGSVLTVAFTGTLWSPPTFEKSIRYVLNCVGNQCRRLTHKLRAELLCKQHLVIPRCCPKDSAPPLQWLVKFFCCAKMCRVRFFFFSWYDCLIFTVWTRSHLLVIVLTVFRWV